MCGKIAEEEEGEEKRIWLQLSIAVKPSAFLSGSLRQETDRQKRAIRLYSVKREAEGRRGA